MESSPPFESVRGCECEFLASPPIDASGMTLSCTPSACSSFDPFAVQAACAQGATPRRARHRGGPRALTLPKYSSLSFSARCLRFMGATYHGSHDIARLENESDTRCVTCDEKLNEDAGRFTNVRLSWRVSGVLLADFHGRGQTFFSRDWLMSVKIFISSR